MFALNVTCHTAATVNMLQKILYYRPEKGKEIRLCTCYFVISVNVPCFSLFLIFSIDFISIFSLDLNLLKLIYFFLWQEIKVDDLHYCMNAAFISLCGHAPKLPNNQ